EVLPRQRGRSLGRAVCVEHDRAEMDLAPNSAQCRIGLVHIEPQDPIAASLRRFTDVTGDEPTLGLPRHESKLESGKGLGDGDVALDWARGLVSLRMTPF